MATGTVGQAAREHPLQMLHYLRKAVAYNTTGIDTGVSFDKYLPANCKICFTMVYVTTAFNAGTTNVLTVGQNASSYNDMVNAADVNEAAAAATMALRGADLNLTADALPFIKYTQTGTAASAGAATVIIVYAVNNDG